MVRKESVSNAPEEREVQLSPSCNHLSQNTYSQSAHLLSYFPDARHGSGPRGKVGHGEAPALPELTFCWGIETIQK